MRSIGVPGARRALLVPLLSALTALCLASSPPAPTPAKTAAPAAATPVPAKPAAPAPAVPAAPVAPMSAQAIKAKIERGEVKLLDEAGFRQVLANAEPAALLDAALLILREHPHYLATLYKWERVGGRWPSEPDVMELRFQRQPLAVFAYYSSGPRKGRRVLYNTTINRNGLLAREGGLLGVMSVHLDLTNPLVKRDTNHYISEIGLEYPLQRTRQDLGLLLQRGQKVDLTKGKWLIEGGRRYYEIVNVTPGPPAFYSHWARLRFDVDLGLMVAIEIRDKQGQQVEQFMYRNIRWTRFPPNAFDEKNPELGF